MQNKDANYTVLPYLLLFMVTSFFFLFFLPSSADSFETPVYIRVGYYDQEGFFTKDKSGDYSGYSYDYLQEIAQYYNWEYQFIQGTENVCQEWLKDGRIDIMSNVSYSKVLDEHIDYSKYVSGISTVGLYALVDDTRFKQGDYDDLNNKRIGIVKGKQRNDVFRNICRENGINVDFFEFESNSQLFKALNTRKIDCAFILTNILPPNVKNISRFPDEQLFFAVSGGNQKLLSQINLAVSNIMDINPSFSTENSKKYFGLKKSSSIELTYEEKQYVLNSKPLRVSYDRQRPPFEFHDENRDKMGGISAEVLKLVASYTGLKIEIIKSKTYGEALKLMKAGEIDLLPGVNRNFTWGMRNNFRVSSAYISAPLVIITKKSGDISFKSIALPENYYLSEKIAAIYNFSDIVYFPSTEDCFQAVKNGKVNATFANSYIANHLLRYGRYRDLNSVNFGDHSEQISMGISRSVDPILLSIINKGINSIPENKLNNIIVKNTFTLVNRNIFDFFYNNQIGITILFTVFLLFTIVTLGLWLHVKSKEKKKLEKLYYYDELTGFKNFNSFLRDTPVIMNQNNMAKYAVVYIDIVEFKFINSTFGYDEGDKILKDISCFLYKFINRPRDTFARINADHFVLLLSFEKEKAFDGKIKSLFSELENLSSKSERDYRPIFNGGVYYIENPNISVNSAVDFAIFAKSSIDKKHATSFAYYSKKIIGKIEEEKQIESSMRNALKNGEFITYLQPKIDCNSEKIIGAEALIRWASPDREILMPDLFIPYFEKSGFITKVDMYIFNEICLLLRRWLDEGREVFPISCNFSYSDISDPWFPKLLKIIAERNQVPTCLLELELTESVAVKHIEKVVACGSELSGYGFKLSIDDFGSGYSSISLLQILKIDTLKLDKDFVQRGLLGKLPHDLVEGLVRAFKNNSMQVVFEGVETAEQVDFVKSLGCSIIQGYFYSMPLPVKDFEDKYLES